MVEIKDRNTAKLETDPEGSVNSSVREEHIEQHRRPSSKDAPGGRSPITGTKLSWLVDNFSGITSNVYEAVMVAAKRARQIGRQQKQEIDRWTATMDVLEPGMEPTEDESEVGIDHFHHRKPTVKAMSELKERKLEYNYPEAAEK